MLSGGSVIPQRSKHTNGERGWRPGAYLCSQEMLEGFAVYLEAEAEKAAVRKHLGLSRGIKI